jgi:hypothetical protein
MFISKSTRYSQNSGGSDNFDTVNLLTDLKPIGVKDRLYYVKSENKFYLYDFDLNNYIVNIPNTTDVENNTTLNNNQQVQINTSIANIADLQTVQNDHAFSITNLNTFKDNQIIKNASIDTVNDAQATELINLNNYINLNTTSINTINTTVGGHDTTINDLVYNVGILQTADTSIEYRVEQLELEQIIVGPNLDINKFANTIAISTKATPTYTNVISDAPTDDTHLTTKLYVDTINNTQNTRLTTNETNITNLQSKTISGQGNITVSTVGNDRFINTILTPSFTNINVSGDRLKLGFESGINNDSNAVAFGYQAGKSLQLAKAVAIGYQAGNSSQQSGAIAIGSEAAVISQSINAVGIGSRAALTNQGSNSISIGFLAGSTNQSANSIAIGSATASSNQGTQCIAIGSWAGNVSQGTSSVAIGWYAGQTSQHTNSIILNATGVALNSSSASSFFVKPVRDRTTNNPSDPVLSYNATSGEITYSSTSGKTFVIDHPIYENKYLVHACLEGPENGVYYRGEGEIIDNKYVVIRLPEYVDKLAFEFTVQLTQIIDGEDDYELILIASSRVKNNMFKVFGKNCKFNWLVHGKRSNIDVEPRREDYVKHGDGPYTYLVKK